MQGYQFGVMDNTHASLTTDPYPFTSTGLLMPTRAFNATRVNSAGLIEEVTVNTALLDLNPVALAQKGLILEESRTNILTYSNTLTNGAREKTRVSFSNSANFLCSLTVVCFY